MKVILTTPVEHATEQVFRYAFDTPNEAVMALGVLEVARDTHLNALDQRDLILKFKQEGMNPDVAIADLVAATENKQHVLAESGVVSSLSPNQSTALWLSFLWASNEDRAALLSAPAPRSRETLAEGVKALRNELYHGRTIAYTAAELVLSGAKRRTGRELKAAGIQQHFDGPDSFDLTVDPKNPRAKALAARR